MQGANTIFIKEVNKDLVRGQLKQMRSATIHQLSQKTGLSVVTVGSLLAEMIETGEAFEASAVPSNGGRPSALYRYNENFKMASILYGYQKDNGNLIRFLVVNLYGECLERREAFFPDVEIESFSLYLDEAIEKYPAIRAIGFGMPGSEENGTVLGCDYKKLVGDRFMKFYRDRYGVPVVFINDVNAAVGGYYAANSGDCIAGLYFPRIYRPGAGIIIKGEIHKGFRGFAGELTSPSMDTDWLTLDYSDSTAIVQAVGKLLAVYCCIVAPERFVLYGDFFSETSAEQIRAYTQSLLPDYFQVSLFVSDNFETDFEQGVICAALEQLEDPIMIKKKGN